MNMVARMFVVASVLLSCSVHEGDSCKPPSGKCTGASEALACVRGTVTRVECRGPAACKPKGSSVTCDQSLASEGDTCIASGVACTVDHSALLICKDGKFVRGADCPQGCVVTGDQATCPAPALKSPLQ